MSPLDLVLDAVVLAWVLYRQRGIRRVRLRFNTRVPVVLLVVGLFQFVHYTDTHSLGAEVSALVIGGFALLQANSKEDAIELVKQFLDVAGDGECELRQVFEAGPGTHA